MAVRQPRWLLQLAVGANPSVRNEGAQGAQGHDAAPLQERRFSRRFPTKRPSAIGLLVTLHSVEVAPQYVLE